MSSCNQIRLSKQQNFENCFGVPSPLFFCKIVEMEDFALLVAILDEGQIYLACPPRYIWNQDGRPYRSALDPGDRTRK